MSVISDVVTDQRVQKECATLLRNGYDVLLLGRKSERNFGLKELPYPVIRFANPFRRGPFMYFIFNLQLFFYLWFKKTDVLWANDLDTLLPNFFISRLKNKKLIYDSHEYFTLSVYKSYSRKIWERMERYLFPRLKNIITVNDSLKNIYEKKYGLPVMVIRNVPPKMVLPEEHAVMMPANTKMLIIQGMGINENRGAEEAVMMMQYLPESFQLYFVGGGTIWDKLKQMTKNLSLSSKIIFVDGMPFDKMMEYTRSAFLGLILEKIDVSDHHLYALPNKFFDYLQAGIPVLSTRVAEVEKLINKYDVGMLINNLLPEKMAEIILNIAADRQVYNRWRKNTIQASAELNWENEEKILIGFMKNLQ